MSKQKTIVQFSKKEIADAKQGNSFLQAQQRYKLLTALRGLKLNQVIEAWKYANDFKEDNT